MNLHEVILKTIKDGYDISFSYITPLSMITVSKGSHVETAHFDNDRLDDPNGLKDYLANSIIGLKARIQTALFLES